MECLQCGKPAKRLISGTHLDPRLGLQSESFPSMAAKWERKRRQKMRLEKD